MKGVNVWEELPSQCKCECVSVRIREQLNANSSLRELRMELLEKTICICHWTRLLRFCSFIFWSCFSFSLSAAILTFIFLGEAGEDPETPPKSASLCARPGPSSIRSAVCFLLRLQRAVFSPVRDFEPVVGWCVFLSPCRHTGGPDRRAWVSQCAGCKEAQILLNSPFSDLKIFYHKLNSPEIYFWSTTSADTYNRRWRITGFVRMSRQTEQRGFSCTFSDLEKLKTQQPERKWVNLQRVTLNFSYGLSKWKLFPLFSVVLRSQRVGFWTPSEVWICRKYLRSFQFV